MSDTPSSSFADVYRVQTARIAELEAEILEQCRLNGMGSEREAKLMADNERLRCTDDGDVLKLISAMRYVIGIAERGEGRAMRDDESAEAFVLGYVKRIEAEIERLRKLMDDAGELICKQRYDRLAARAEAERLLAALTQISILHAGGIGDIARAAIDKERKE